MFHSPDFIEERVNVDLFRAHTLRIIEQDKEARRLMVLCMAGIEHSEALSIVAEAREDERQAA